MSFEVTAEAYSRFMGRYADPLAPLFADLAVVRHGQRALDVGCGPGTLTAVLVDRLGQDAVAAIDPSDSFVAATAARFPKVAVRSGSAEELPYADDEFDLTLAQLVVHFMSDPVAGLREMGRVTRPGGSVAACVWDHAGGEGPLSLFWRCAAELDPSTPGESSLPGTSEGDLARLAAEAGLSSITSGSLSVVVHCETFADWWAPYTLGVGPAGAYVAGLAPPRREALRARCASRLPSEGFEVTATAWSVVARP
ncbi:putative methyltransferase, S-Adenosyl-L-methionine (SAM)-MTase protein [metagenome]|uniref:Putative methyltransferase, S-Adenosyl-L-methionine (SAM)-MTase protein n=1 Tax=metagenome TaxID=256318 RepID=A0A2P2BZQ7_9ZZZZ